MQLLGGGREEIFFKKLKGKSFHLNQISDIIFFLSGFFFSSGWREMLKAEIGQFLSRHNKLLRVNSWDFLLA